MIKQASIHDLKKEIDFVPQAIVRHSIFDIAEKMGTKAEGGYDDLDEFYGCAFLLDALPFALMHYRGHPKDTTTIYLPYKIHSLPQIREFLNAIVAQLKITPNEIMWQRSEEDLPKAD